MTPYRTPAEKPADTPPPLEVTDADLLVPSALIWIASVFEVGLAASTGEAFGVGLTLACFVIVLVPILAKEGFTDVLLRRRTREHDAARKLAAPRAVCARRGLSFSHPPSQTRRVRIRFSMCLFVTTTLAALRASAQPAAPPAPAATAVPAASAPPATASAAPGTAPSGPALELDGYVEAHYSRNFNEPENGITHYRGFDNRHDSFTISNVVLGGTFDYESLSGRLALQIGHTPSTYYLAEPSSPGASGAASTGVEVFKYIQQAYVGWKAPLGRGLLLQAGVFLSPIGPEGMAVKDNWSWSRSNLFFGLPFYHTGFKATYDVTDRLSVVLLVSNGWNSIVDNNFDKSVSVQLLYKVPERLTVSLLYFGGNERPRAAPEGAPWRHLADLWAQLDATAWLSFLAQANAGFERNRFGTSSWVAGALYARVQPAKWLYLAARGDLFHERAAANDEGAASRIFWPVDTVGSGTFTVDFRPVFVPGGNNVSFRVEYRHNEADGDMFFRGAVEGNGVSTPYVPNASSQDTLTVGLTGWL